ncbi:MAG: hypothetical protein ACAH95_13315 [Fimbriimonas sp.]
MSSLRRLLSYVVVALLTLGYLASQWAALNGTASDYAARVDIKEVKLLSLLLLIAALVLAFIPDREVEPE